MLTQKMWGGSCASRLRAPWTRPSGWRQTDPSGRDDVTSMMSAVRRRRRDGPADSFLRSWRYDSDRTWNVSPGGSDQRCDGNGSGRVAMAHDPDAPGEGGGWASCGGGATARLSLLPLLCPFLCLVAMDTVRTLLPIRHLERR